jgi:hypothetical protein
MRQVERDEEISTGRCRFRVASFVLSFYLKEMDSDEIIEFYVDLEGRKLARCAMDAHAPQLGRQSSCCHCATQGSRTVRADRTGSAGWICDGLAVVALSPAEEWGWLRPISGEITAFALNESTIHLIVTGLALGAPIAVVRDS